MVVEWKGLRSLAMARSECPGTARPVHLLPGLVEHTKKLLNGPSVHHHCPTPSSLLCYTEKARCCDIPELDRLSEYLFFSENPKYVHSVDAGELNTLSGQKLRQRGRLRSKHRTVRANTVCVLSGTVILYMAYLKLRSVQDVMHKTNVL